MSTYILYLKITKKFIEIFAEESRPFLSHAHYHNPLLANIYIYIWNTRHSPIDDPNTICRDHTCLKFCCFFFCILNIWEQEAVALPKHIAACKYLFLTKKISHFVPHKEHWPTAFFFFCSNDTKKSFLPLMLIVNKNWIYFENPKPKNSWVDVGVPSIPIPRPNVFVRKTILCVRCSRKSVVCY